MPGHIGEQLVMVKKASQQGSDNCCAELNACV